MLNHHQPSAEVISYVKDIPVYRRAIDNHYFPVLEKPEIAKNFPENWMTPQLADALASGKAEMVLSTGTHHARMQIIRPPLFLLHSYYELWRQHPDIGVTWALGCQRISLTTMLATEHVARVNAKKGTSQSALQRRRLDARTLYLNKVLDPARWSRDDVVDMLDDIKSIQQQHPAGLYHLDCSSYHLMHLLLKIAEFNLDDDFPEPGSIVHAYEYTPSNVRAFLINRFACPVIDLFGSTELGYLYYNDRQGRYVPYLDKMAIELIPFVAGSSVYSLIVSSVRNPYMPLIRYRTGDCVQTTDGTANPEKVMRFCGREKEMLFTPKGILSQADFDDLIAAVSGDIFIYQLKVNEDDSLLLSYTTFGQNPISSMLTEKLHGLIVNSTGLDVLITHQTHIPIGKSGKYAWIQQ
ncbi:hypothetical protein ACFL9S_12500 [Erwinia sp. AnSW2-5]|uniref:hypothetical protein n=1 Tax=Erwinia sp. AnSW2-5 TaxID=3367692 RepID=UPI00385DAAFE